MILSVWPDINSDLIMEGLSKQVSCVELWPWGAIKCQYTQSWNIKFEFIA